MSPNENPQEEVAKNGLDHAWDWFALHAGQRMQSFNFFLLATAFLVAAYGAVIEKHPHVAVGVALLGAWLAFWFNRLDVRSNQLVRAGEAALRPLEKNLADKTSIRELAIVAAVDSKARGSFSYSVVINVVQWTLLVAFLAGAGYAAHIAWGGVAIRSGVDVAIVTVIQEEYDAVLQHLDTHRHDPGSRARPNLYAWEVGEVAPRDSGGPFRVVVALAGHAGNLPGAEATRETVERWNPRYVLLVGIAGGFAKEGLGKGDVVVSSLILGYEYGTLAKKFLPRDDFVFQVDGPLLRSAQALAAQDSKWMKDVKPEPPELSVSPKVVVGPVASGEKVVDDATGTFFLEVLVRWPRVVAVEMEGAGAVTAVEAVRNKGGGVGFLMIRGISDMPLTDSHRVRGKSSQKEERDRWKRYAADVAAVFAIRLIRHGWPVRPS